MRLYYIAYAKMPTEKAHGIHIAKTCEAFIESGVDVTLVIPNRRGSEQSLKDFYGLRVDVPTVRVPVIDLGNKGPIRYRIGAFSFVISYLWYLYTRAVRRDSILYTVDLDHFSFIGLPLAGLPVFSEIHGGKPNRFFHRFFFSNVRGVIATTPVTASQLSKAFLLPAEKILTEANGVDPISVSYTKEEARERLHLDAKANFVLYVGRVLAWKGIDILPRVAHLAPEVTIGFLGATKEEYERVLDTSAGDVQFYGSVAHSDVPLWLQAADACLVLGTARDKHSYHYTSPMKLFEYMMASRPVLASRTPALQSVFNEEDCFYFEPDSPEDTARVLKEFYEDPKKAQHIAMHGKSIAENHTWRKRAERITAFMNRHQSV